MVLRSIYLIILVVLLNSCDDEYKFDAEALTYQGKFIYTNQIRFDGIYLKDYTDDLDLIMYLYQDGTYLSFGTERFESNCIDCLNISDGMREDPAYWGCFIICNDTLKVQTYDSSSANGYYGVHEVEEWWAIIEDSVTLSFFKRFRSDGGIEDYNDRTFIFHECSNKPDSTNILME